MEDRYLFKAKRLDNGEWEICNLITNVFFRLGHLPIQLPSFSYGRNTQLREHQQY